MAMEQYLITKTPPAVYYVPNFITERESDILWQKIYAAPQPKWTALSNRRLQNWGGIPHSKGMVVEKLPHWLEECGGKISALGVFGDRVPNHVLVNEYLTGQGIMPHEDGPLYHPVVTTISLGSHTLLDFYNPVMKIEGEDASLESRYLFSILLEPRSLLVLREDMYSKYLHGIADRCEDAIASERISNFSQLGESLTNGEIIKRTTRVSLTIRHVPKTLKVKLRLGK